MSDRETDALDGNAAAGAFGAVFAADVTTAVVVCAGCGHRDVFARLAVYARGPGVVVRCHGCDTVLARVVETPDSTWVELTGSASWRLPS
ncbi:DUF6510 family protein [Nocardioides sp. GXQ0305]|uniref:DUF6510 family protein n=1 Tax=Nocardioides sp. GXQ0305 TaxID=3423912 RepID=UPI003D7CEE67